MFTYTNTLTCALGYVGKLCVLWPCTHVWHESYAGLKAGVGTEGSLAAFYGTCDLHNADPSPQVTLRPTCAYFLAPVNNMY